MYVELKMRLQYLYFGNRSSIIDRFVSSKRINSFSFQVYDQSGSNRKECVSFASRIQDFEKLKCEDFFRKKF